MLYAETGTKSLSWRTKLLTRKYLINLSHNPHNPMHKPFFQLTTTITQWKPRSTPGLIKEFDFVESLGISLFSYQLQIPSTYKYPPPSRPPNCKTLWFPPTKNKPRYAGTGQQTSSTSQQKCTGEIHQGLHRRIQIINPARPQLALSLSPP